jgi:hypothetical protein
LWSQGAPLFVRFAALMRTRTAAILGDDVEHAAELATSYPRLSARDIVHLAVMHRLGVERIVSADRAFDAVPDIAGRFRRPGEVIYFGADDDSDPHWREGTPGERIESELSDVFAAVQRSLARGEAIERTIAVFLQKFFEVHPFVDGNGRIGRLFAALLAAHGGRKWHYPEAGGNAADERAWTEALRVAHMWCAAKSNARDRRRGWQKEPQNPMGLLESWVRAHLYDPDDDRTVEEPPE